MNTFKRIKDIISSNINAVLDKMEDPEKMIDLSISEMEDTVLEIRRTIAEKNTEIKTAESILKEKKEAITRWEGRAKAATEKGLDDMAREAIGEKLRLSDEIMREEENLAALKNLLSALESSREEGEAKLLQMKKKSSEIKESARNAKERKKAAEIARKSENLKYERRLEEIRAKLDRWEAESDVILNDRKTEKPTFEDIEREAAIDKELAELKRMSSAS